ncbi:MAG: hypothetical protein ACI9WU_005524 [Myxococcota bacterium]|jgi:hypothetical protein
MKNTKCPGFAAACIALLLGGCSGPGGTTYPEYLPFTASRPVVPETPRAWVPSKQDKTRAGAIQGPAAAAGEITCEGYCSAWTDACAYDTGGLARGRAQCLADCSAWAQGEKGVRDQDTLACRRGWVRQASVGVKSACWNAATASAACVGVAHRAPPLNLNATEVLGLYDSTDAPSWGGGTRARKTILGSRVRFALRKLGLVLVLWDVKGGLPPRDVVAAARGIVTVFYDAEMSEAAKYGAWLRGQIEVGRRVVVLNNYGAWRESGGDFVDERIPNLVFEALGVRYMAMWTSDPTVLQVSATYTDESVFDKVPRVAAARHYYLFRPSASDVRIHLGVQRTDIDDSISAVVMSSPRGGLALSRYYESRDGEQHLLMTRFLERALLLR